MASLDASEKETLANLLHDDDFMVFMQEAPSVYQTKDEFMTLPMPSGIDPESMWKLVSFARRMRGRPFVRDVVPTSEKLPYELAFWTTTPDIISSLNKIVSRTNDDSQLWSSLEAVSCRKQMVDLLVDDVFAAVIRDGLDVDHATVEELAMRTRNPQNDVQGLVRNTLDLLGDLDRYRGRPIDEPFLMELFHRISEGAASVPYNPRRPAPSPVGPDRLAQSKETYLKDIVDNSTSPYKWGIHPLFMLLLNSDIIWELLPFERFNGLMEIIVRNVSFLDAGVPALRFVPLSRMRLDWESRLIGPPEAPMRYGEALIVTDFGIDSTPYLQQIIRFLEHGVDKLETTVQSIEDEDERYRSLIDQDCRLTHRQKTVLKEMVADPGITIDINTYMARFDVVASTARGDLDKLVSLGFLLSRFESKKQLFWARPDLHRAIAGQHPSSR